MRSTFDCLIGAGIGAGLMYLYDPQLGKRRQAQIRDQAVRLAHEAQDAAGVVARDMQNRAQGLAAGDFSGIIGDRNPLETGWSPSGRAILTGVGLGMFLYGLTRSAPMACVLGTVGLALTAEGVTNARLEDIQEIPERVSETVTSARESLAGSLGYSGR